MYQIKSYIRRKVKRILFKMAGQQMDYDCTQNHITK